MKTTEKIMKGIAWILPILFLIILIYFLTGAYWLPGITPAKAGVSWQECEVSGWMDSANWQKLQECFTNYSDKPAAHDDFPQMGAVLHSPFTSIHKPFRLNGDPIFVEKLGFKYYVNYRGRKMGLVFDQVFTTSCCENANYSITAGEGYYAFREKRGGRYYLVMISVPAGATGQ
jgi:hypothetical protein